MRANFFLLILLLGFGLMIGGFLLDLPEGVGLLNKFYIWVLFILIVGLGAFSKLFKLLK